ncbi:MAG TPA: response regulator transcription factor [Caulobacterales bacterium]|nr:response regulator transcription factor [Caulobacterales bacterium]
MSGRVLVVEDEQAAADYVAKGLREHGYVVETVEDGRDGLYLATSSEFDAIVLDRNLPGMDGLSMLKAIRAGGVETPVLILSALGHIDERVKGLRAGGDDYLAKPFGFSELLARLEALMRRRAPGRSEQTKLSCADLEMDLLTRRVTRAGKPITLLPREFKILEFLMRNADRVVTRTMLLEHVWDYRFDPHSSLIDTHMSRLRKKIDDGFEPPLLHTIRGAGYRLSREA